MILYGAGGHAKVVYESLQKLGIVISYIIDDNPDIVEFKGMKVQHNCSQPEFKEEQILIAIGSNRHRLSVASKLNNSFVTLIDSSAIVSPTTILGEDTMILAGAIIQSSSTIGSHCIINTGAIVEHDCIIGDGVHIGPAAVLCGRVVLGKGVMVGANATIAPGTSIGDWAIVGAGAVVITDVSAGSTVVGNPARPLAKS